MATNPEVILDHCLTFPQLQDLPFRLEQSCPALVELEQLYDLGHRAWTWEAPPGFTHHPDLWGQEGTVMLLGPWCCLEMARTCCKLGFGLKAGMLERPEVMAAMSESIQQVAQVVGARQKIFITDNLYPPSGWVQDGWEMDDILLGLRAYPRKSSAREVVFGQEYCEGYWLDPPDPPLVDRPVSSGWRPITIPGTGNESLQAVSLDGIELDARKSWLVGRGSLLRSSLPGRLVPFDSLTPHLTMVLVGVKAVRYGQPNPDRGAFYRCRSPWLAATRRRARDGSPGHLHPRLLHYRIGDQLQVLAFTHLIEVRENEEPCGRLIHFSQESGGTAAVIDFVTGRSGEL